MEVLYAFGIFAFFYFPIVFWSENQEIKRREKEKRNNIERALKNLREKRWK